MSNKVEYIISLKDGNFSAGIDNANSKVNNLESSLGKIGAAAAAAFAFDGIKNAVMDITNVGATFDSYEAGLATLMKSEQKAHSAFLAYKEDAKSTPFDTESIVLANRAIISAGGSASEARETVMALGNAIAATGGTSENLKGMAVNLNQIKSLGKASALDIKQFVFAGIPIYQLLSKTMGKTVEEVKKMDVSYEVLAKSLKEAQQAGGMFEGGLEKQSASVAGMISNLDESVVFFKDYIYEAFKPAIIDSIASMSAFVDKGRVIVAYIKEMNFQPVINSIKKLKDSFSSMLEGIDKIGRAFGSANNEVSIFDSIISGLANTLNVVTFPMRMIYEGVGKIGEAFEEFTPYAMGFMAVVKELALGVADQFGNIGDVISGVFTFDDASAAVAIDRIKSGLSNLEGNFELAFEAAYEKQKKNFDKRRTTGKHLGEEEQGYIEEETISGLPAGGGSDLVGKSKGSSASRVKGSSPTHVTISINNLIETMSFNTTNLQESTAKIKEEVTKYLLSVVNDANIVAGR